MVESKRKQGENFEGFLRKFNKRLQQSRKLFKAREIKYLQPTSSKNQRKKRALSSKRIKDEKEYLRKVGKLQDDHKTRW